MNLKKIIREEIEGEWNWVQDEPNIWLSYQMLLFDEVPTKEDVKKFIMNAFNSGLVCQEGIDAWMAEGIDRDVRGIVKDAENNLKPYLRIDLNDEWFYMGIEYDIILDSYKDLRSIKYSEAKNYLINENDIGWIIDINPNGTICDVIDYLHVGEMIQVSNIYDWINPDIIYNNITGEILEINNCNKIMKDNNSKDPTILIHFKEKYGGFTESWYKHLYSENSKEICSDGRCMFLICGEDGEGQEGIRITLLPKNLQESDEKDDWGWVTGEALLPLSDYVYEYKIEDLDELIGVKVKLSPESRYYKEQLKYVDDYTSGDRDNPIDVIGTIVSTTGLQREDNLPLYVKWANYSENNYNTWDLDIVL